MTDFPSYLDVFGALIFGIGFIVGRVWQAWGYEKEAENE